MRWRLPVIKGWFERNFPDHTVECAIISARAVVRFRAYGPAPNGSHHELEVAFAALEEHGAALIAHDLDAAHAVELWRRDPTACLRYDRHRRLRATTEEAW